MNLEDRLAARAAYRRALDAIHFWDPAEGVEMTVICRPQDCRVDVILSSQGIAAEGVNAQHVGHGEMALALDCTQRILLAEIIRRYMTKEVTGKDGIIFDMKLGMAERAFVEGLESALCRGKGGKE